MGRNRCVWLEKYGDVGCRGLGLNYLIRSLSLDDASKIKGTHPGLWTVLSYMHGKLTVIIHANVICTEITQMGGAFFIQTENLPWPQTGIRILQWLLKKNQTQEAIYSFNEETLYRHLIQRNTTAHLVHRVNSKYIQDLYWCHTDDITMTTYTLQWRFL